MSDSSEDDQQTYLGLFDADIEHRSVCRLLPVAR